MVCFSDRANKSRYLISTLVLNGFDPEMKANFKFQVSQLSLVGGSWRSDPGVNNC
jgi:hypothetical protein